MPQTLKVTAQLTVVLKIYDGQPVLRYSVKFRNLTASTVYINHLDLLPWSFDDEGGRYTAFRVNQWSTGSPPADFEPFERDLEPGGSPFEVHSGAHGQQCGW